VHVAVIVNPAAGRSPRPDKARGHAELAARVIASQGATADIFVTEGPGHASELTRDAVARGASVVFAWGGDGTVNEVGSVLVSGGASLAIVPAGSGNGLALGLGIPREPSSALRHGLTAPVRRIDVGEIDGCLFLNVAGIGFDAHIAERFARAGGRRGLRGYAGAIARELFTYAGEPCELTIGGSVREHTAFMLVIANGPQWGNGAQIAPHARLDDGLLDVVSVAPRSPLRAVWEIPHLFTGTFPRVPGVTTDQVAELRISGRAPLMFHFDGQPARCESGRLNVLVHHRALQVRA
jgi:YegS/Rv2252/BmrU family lipid kinase